MEKKYELLENEVVYIYMCKLHRIKALKDFGDVKAGDFGGWIESEKNLDQDGNCWIYDEAKVFDDAMVIDNARIDGHAEIYESSCVRDDSYVGCYARVHGNAEIRCNAYVYSHADVHGHAIVKGYIT